MDKAIGIMRRATTPLLQKIINKFIHKLDQPKPGEIYEFDIENPFKIFYVKVIGVKDGYVKFTYDETDNPDSYKESFTDSDTVKRFMKKAKLVKDVW